MTITEFAWLRHGQPLPEGWRLADQAITLHHHYCVLIQKIEVLA